MRHARRRSLGHASFESREALRASEAADGKRDRIARVCLFREEAALARNPGLERVGRHLPSGQAMHVVLLVVGSYCRYVVAFCANRLPEDESACNVPGAEAEVASLTIPAWCTHSWCGAAPFGSVDCLTRTLYQLRNPARHLSSSRTAMVTVFDVAPPMEITTGTTFPSAEATGTLAF